MDLGDSSGSFKGEGVEITQTNAVCDHAPRPQVLDTKTERVKFYSAIVVTCELANKKKIANQGRNNQHIVKSEIKSRCMKDGIAARGDRDRGAITDGNNRVRKRKARKKDNIVGGHVRGSTTVHDPWARAEREVVHSSDQAGRVPCW